MGQGFDDDDDDERFGANWKNIWANRKELWNLCRKKEVSWRHKSKALWLRTVIGQNALIEGSILKKFQLHLGFKK